METQEKVLNYIKDYIGEKGYSPSFRDIMNGVGLASLSPVAYHLASLVAAGLIVYEPGVARTIRIIESSNKPEPQL